MKKTMTAALALSLLGSAAFAGGPTVVYDDVNPTVVTAAPARGGAWVPIVLGGLALCAIACGSDS